LGEVGGSLDRSLPYLLHFVVRHREELSDGRCESVDVSIGNEESVDSMVDDVSRAVVDRIADGNAASGHAFEHDEGLAFESAREEAERARVEVRFGARSVPVQPHGIRDIDLSEDVGQSRPVLTFPIDVERVTSGFSARTFAIAVMASSTRFSGTKRAIIAPLPRGRSVVESPWRSSVRFGTVSSLSAVSLSSSMSLRCCSVSVVTRSKASRWLRHPNCSRVSSANALLSGSLRWWLCSTWQRTTLSRR